MTYSLKSLLPKVGLIILLTAGPVAAVEGDARVSRDGSSYFKHEGGTFSHYLELRSDGSYRRVVRGRLYAEERDHGKWQQNSTQKLLLRSDQHFHNISSGDLLISMWQRDRLKTLPDLKQRVQAFLKANRAQEFPAEDIEHIRDTEVEGGPGAKIGDIMVLSSKRVSRSDLEKLVGAIDTFLSSSEKNLFALVPLEHRASTVFVDEDWAHTAKSAITDESAGDSPSGQSADKHGYLKIDAAQFEKETKEAQSVLSASDANKHAKPPGQD